MELPGDFDPQCGMIATPVLGAVVHPTRFSAQTAEALLSQGDPVSIRQAQVLLESVLRCQLTEVGHAHYGNFLWLREDATVLDLNAVNFVLRHLIPMLIRHGALLPSDLRDRILESIRVGLEEIARMDVAITYTNIAAMDASNSCLGGELLGDPAVAERGRRKLMALADLTARNGTIFEFNSPTYTLVTLGALQSVWDLSQAEVVRTVARMMGLRQFLSVALHMDPTSGRWLGPYSRAYPPTVLCEVEPEIGILRKWVEDGIAPAWLGRVGQSVSLPCQIDETAMAEWGITSCIYRSTTFSLALASREISRQTGVMTIHHTIPDVERPALVYSRYLLDDCRFGADSGPSAENRSPLPWDEGKFYGVQAGPRVIGLYSPRTLEHFGSLAPCSHDAFESAQAVLVWTQRKHIDEIWVGPSKMSALPLEVPDGEVVVIACGTIYVAVRPLTRTDLGCGAPIRLTEGNDELVLHLYNYLGPRRNHQELERRSRFYRGQPQCGFYLEVAPRSEYVDGSAFGVAVARGALHDSVGPLHTAYMASSDRTWRVEYARDGKILGIEVNLMEWDLKRRWNEGGDLGWPMLNSPMAKQTDDGVVQVGPATLRCGKHPAWLWGDEKQQVWVAAYHGKAAPLSLCVPGGQVDIDAMGPGTLVWDQGAVTLEGREIAGEPRIRGGHLAGPART